MPNPNLVPRVPAPDAAPERNRQFIDRVAKIFNDLLLRGDITLDGDRKFQLAGGGGGGGGGSGGTSTNDFRITLSSTEPVPTVQLANEDTLFLSPYTGNQIALYTGSAWAIRETAQVSLPLDVVADKNYDVFAKWTGAVVELELSAAWSNDSTRADALTQLDGVWVKDADNTLRLVGTIRASDTDECDDTLVRRFVWNAANRVRRPLRFAGNTGTHTYTIDTWRASAGNDDSAVGLVCGLIGGEIHLSILQVSDNGATGGRWVSVSDNSASTPDHANAVIMAPHVTGNGFSFCWYDAVPGVGYHKYRWMEISDATGTSTWIDEFTNAHITEQAGMRGYFDM